MPDGFKLGNINNLQPTYKFLFDSSAQQTGDVKADVGNLAVTLTNYNATFGVTGSGDLKGEEGTDDYAQETDGKGLYPDSHHQKKPRQRPFRFSQKNGLIRVRTSPFHPSPAVRERTTGSIT